MEKQTLAHARTEQALQQMTQTTKIRTPNKTQEPDMLFQVGVVKLVCATQLGRSHTVYIQPSPTPRTTTYSTSSRRLWRGCGFPSNQRQPTNQRTNQRTSKNVMQMYVFILPMNRDYHPRHPTNNTPLDHAPAPNEWVERKKKQSSAPRSKPNPHALHIKSKQASHVPNLRAKTTCRNRRGKHPKTSRK